MSGHQLGGARGGGSMGSVAAYGVSISGSFARFNPASSSWRTDQLSFTGESTEFSETWPQAGSMRNGQCSALATSVPHTDVIASILLPTPTKAMGKRGWGLSRTGRNRYSSGVIASAFRFGYKPPISLLEWMMGFPQGYTSTASGASEMLSSLKSQSGLASESLRSKEGENLDEAKA